MPATQIIGNDNAGNPYLWEMVSTTNSVKTFKNPVNINTLLPPNSGWNVTHVVSINDNGCIVGTATASDGTVHGILLAPAYQIQVDAFIPQQWVTDPTGYVYNGNSRKTPLDGSFATGTATFIKSSSPPLFKMEQTVMVTVLQNVDPGGIQEASSLVTTMGPTKKYYAAAVPGGTSTLTNTLSPTAAPFATQTAVPAIATATITHSSSQVVTVELIGKATDPLANPLAPVIETPDPAPPLYYDITVKIDATTTPPTYTLSGNHKLFPAYEVYINGQLVHDFSPIPGGNTPYVMGLETTGPSLSDPSITGGCATMPKLTGTITNQP